MLTTNRGGTLLKTSVSALSIALAATFVVSGCQSQSQATLTPAQSASPPPNSDSATATSDYSYAAPTGEEASNASTPTVDGPADSSPSQPTAEPAAPQPSLTPNAQQVVVDWDSGKGTPENPALDPSPQGWYEAAFGGPASAQGRVLYVTFDDGPGAATAEVLDILDQYQAKATFFVVGSAAAQAPATLDAINARGHALGAHTWSHPDLTGLSAEGVREELDSTLAVAPQIGGCMRPTYGSIDAQSGAVAEEMGLQPIMWTGQAFDWRPPPVSKIVADIKSVTSPGAVILLHDGGGDRSNTVAALRELMPFWQSQGYRLEAIPVCR